MNAQKSPIFISYSHRDLKYVTVLKTHFEAVREQYDLDIWDDSRIKLGKPWKTEIVQALEHAKIGVLIVSPDFLASPFVTQVELPKLLAAAHGGGLTVCIVHVRTSVVRLLKPLGSLQSVNDPEKPISSVPRARRDKAWRDIVEKILEAVQEKREHQSQTSAALTAYESIAHKFRLFCLKALDLKSGFQFVGESALESGGDLEELNNTIKNYNVIAEDLLTRGATYVMSVARLVPSDLESELRELLAYAVDEIHRNYAFQLNEVRVRMNRLHRGEVATEQSAAFAAEIREDMQPLIRGLADKVPVLEHKLDRLLEKIARL